VREIFILPLKTKLDSKKNWFLFFAGQGKFILSAEKLEEIFQELILVSFR
jgi:hypothetical protein